MKFQSNNNFETLEHVHVMTFTSHDIQNMGPLQPWDRYALEHFSRDEASIEEKLMALQILARAIESGHDAPRYQDTAELTE